jgi:TonB family protein
MRNFGSMGRRRTVNIADYLPDLEGRGIFLLAFSLSIVIHIIMVLFLHGIFPGPWVKSPARTYTIDLIRPPVEEIMKNKREEFPPVRQIHAEPPVEAKEATISLDTKDAAYVPYTTVLKEKIRSQWVYPLYAQENLIQGTLLILFRLDSGGNLVDLSVMRSSEYEILDRYALKAIRSANPFPPFPESVTVDFLNINASFAYQLQFE